MIYLMNEGQYNRRTRGIVLQCFDFSILLNPFTLTLSTPMKRFIAELLPMQHNYLLYKHIIYLLQATLQSIQIYVYVYPLSSLESQPLHIFFEISILLTRAGHHRSQTCPGVTNAITTLLGLPHDM